MFSSWRAVNNRLRWQPHHDVRSGNSFEGWRAMAQVTINRAAAQSGSVPNLCVCCGQPAQAKKMVLFRHTPTWILWLNMLPLRSMGGAHSRVMMPTPLCPQHQGRLGIPLLVRLGFWLILLVAMVLLAMAVLTPSPRLLPWAIFGGAAAFVVLNMCVFLVEIYTPRMISQDYQAVKFAAVSPEFARAAGGAMAEPQSSGVNWAILFLMSGSGLMMMMLLSCSGLVSGGISGTAVASTDGSAADGGSADGGPSAAGTADSGPRGGGTSVAGGASNTGADGTTSPGVTRPGDTSSSVTSAGDSAAPKDLDQAIAWAKGVETPKVKAGLQFITVTSVDPQRQAEVSAALAGLLSNPTKDVAALNAMQTWGVNDSAEEVRSYLDRIKLDSSASVQHQLAIKILGDAADADSASLIASFLPSRSASSAAAALASIGKPAEAEVLPYMNHISTDARTYARNLLQGYETSNEVLIDRCLVDFKDVNTQVRNYALSWLAKTDVVEEKREEVSQALNPLLVNTSTQVATRSVLDKWATVHNIPAITAAIDDATSFRKRDYLPLLGKIQHVSAVEAIIQQLADYITKTESIRVLALYGPKIEPILQRHLLNPVDNIASGCCDVLAEIGTIKSLKPLKKVYAVAKAKSSYTVYRSAEKAYNAIEARGVTIDPATGKPMVSTDAVRDWTVDGEKVKMSFVSFTNGKPNFQKEDGSSVSYSMNELSRADQAYIRNILRNRP